MTDLERYVIEEHVEDYNDGIISRRELLRRVTFITGSTVATVALLATIGCGEPSSTSTSPTASVAPMATPPQLGSLDGITVRADDPRIRAQAIDVKASDGATLMGYLATPSRDGRFPGVLVVQENRGLVEHIKDVVRRLATAGFSAISVDLLSRQGGAARLSDPAQYAGELTKRQSADMVSDLQAALNALKGQSSVLADKRGVVGFCFGGGMVWNLLAAGTDLKAAVPYYGPAPAKVEDLSKTRAAVLAIYAEQDTRITSTAPNVEAQLKKAGQPYEIKVFPGVNHAFHNDSGPRYNAQQAQLAWVATIDWFKKYLA